MPTVKQCYLILGLEDGVSLDEVKASYRKLAFALHPDLNPNLAEANSRFHLVNQAYVRLVRKLKEESAAQAHYDQQNKEKNHSKAKVSQVYQHAQKTSSQNKKEPSTTKEKQQDETLLRDILQDEFARRVYEDIYSCIEKETKIKKTPPHPSHGISYKKSKSKDSSPHTTQSTKAIFINDDSDNKAKRPSSILSKLSYWIKRQIDEEQAVYLPSHSLVPGSKIRLHIQHGFLGKPQAVEFVLPPEFSPEKPIRLRGLGKKIGSWTGDLYVRLISS